MDTTKTAENVTAATPNSEQIKTEIDETRQRMDETIAELEERLNPRNVMNQVVDYVRSSPDREGRTLARDVQRAGWALARQVRAHPFPSILVGAGITWWIVSRRRHHHASRHGRTESWRSGNVTYGHLPGAETMPEPLPGAEAMASSAATPAAEPGSDSAISNAAHQVTAKAQQAGAAAADAARRLRERASHMASTVKERVQTGMHYGADKLRHGTEEYPVMMGLGFFALGVLAGLAVPISEQENRVMGPTAARVKNRARTAGSEAARRVSETLKHEAAGLADKAGQVAARAGEALTGGTHTGNEPDQQTGDPQRRESAPQKSGEHGCGCGCA